jgi:hypothetical protein
LLNSLAATMAAQMSNGGKVRQIAWRNSAFNAQLISM